MKVNPLKVNGKVNTLFSFFKAQLNFLKIINYRATLNKVLQLFDDSEVISEM